MQQEKKEKEGHLKQLEELVRQENVHGKQPYYFMRFIGNQFPLEFILFMKKHRSGKLFTDKDFLDECLPLAISIVNDLYLKFQKFLIHPPQSEEEKKEFEYVVVKLEELIQRQNREN